MTQEPEKKEKSAQWIQLGVVVIALAIVAYFVIRFIMGFIWWILAFLGVGLLFVNRKMVMRIVNYIRGLYKKSTVLGVAATVGGVVAFTPFMGFLLLKTIWDFRKSDMVKKNKGKVKTADVDAQTIIDIDSVEADSTLETKYLDQDYKNYPPNGQ